MEQQILWLGTMKKPSCFSVRSAYKLAVRNFYGVGDIGTSLNSEQGRAAWKKLWQVK